MGNNRAGRVVTASTYNSLCELMLKVKACEFKMSRPTGESRGYKFPFIYHACRLVRKRTTRDQYATHNAITQVSTRTIRSLGVVSFSGSRACVLYEIGGRGDAVPPPGFEVNLPARDLD
jgi:hypothetical protein